MSEQTIAEQASDIYRAEGLGGLRSRVGFMVMAERAGLVAIEERGNEFITEASQFLAVHYDLENV